MNDKGEFPDAVRSNGRMLMIGHPVSSNYNPTDFRSLSRIASVRLSISTITGYSTRQYFTTDPSICWRMCTSARNSNSFPYLRHPSKGPWAVRTITNRRVSDSVLETRSDTNLCHVRMMVRCERSVDRLRIKSRPLESGCRLIPRMTLLINDLSWTKSDRRVFRIFSDSTYPIQYRRTVL